ncbi:hypothetical protein ACFP81_01010 [Deinococcus lacus]|uniref:Uncharacterized protein n=1 Tax=Deinococcus lacus TaxID=392561 RepID=A0ABW1Y987_9DEIO
MKKILMGLMGVALLASCGVGGVDNSRVPTTNWRLDRDVTVDGSNKVIKAGTYVVCDNTNTTVALPVQWTAGTDLLTLYAKGERDGAVKALASYTVPDRTVGGNSTVTFTFGPHMAP